MAEVALGLALADVTQPLFARGYTAAQLDAWDHRESFLASQFLFRVGTMAPGIPVESFDLRATFADLAVIVIGGQPVGPGSPDVGGATAP